MPFGSGTDGAYSSATIPTLVKLSCSGTAASTALTVSSTTFANGDVLLLHQSRGTGVGQWEINRVLSGGGTTSLTLQVALKYTYTDSGASQAQAVKVFQYTDCTVASGTWTVPAWDENVGGILPIAIKNNITVTGNTVSTSAGYNYGPSGTRTTTQPAANGYQGEGPAADSSQSTSANGSSGGGGEGGNEGRAGGGGGGYAASGANGESIGTSGAGTGGGTDGSADLTDMLFGGTGGTGGANNGATDGDLGGYGGRGGGIIFLFAKDVTLSGSLISNGGNGTDRSEGGGGGGGAGGSVIVVCQTATLGTNKITVAAGSGGTGSAGGAGNGGAGAVGRIAVHHSGTVTGTTTPTFTDVTDLTLKESFGGSFLWNLV
jgi:hypothetical protein